jgi:hypothetical protein
MSGVVRSLLSGRGSWSNRKMPALVKITLIFALMLLAIRLKAPIGGALLGGAILLGIFFQYPAVQIGSALVRHSIDADTVSLLFLVILILGLSEAMNVCGQLQRIVDSVSALVRGKRQALVALPALIGLLPMPGGAVFSAPMVESVARENGISPHRKTAINYWFRHIWEYWWPLYPGVILAVALTEIPRLTFMAAQIPFTVVAVTAGYLFMLRTPKLDTVSGSGNGEPGSGDAANGSRTRAFLREVFPIVLIVGAMMVLSYAMRVRMTFGTREEIAQLLGDLPPALVLFGRWAAWLGQLPEWAKQAPLIIAIVLGLGWVAVSNHLSGKQVFRSLFGKSTPKMVVLVFGVMLFKGLLEDSGAVKDLTAEMQDWGIPLIGVAMFVPFIAGIVTGIAVGFVGASFPLVVSLIHAQGMSHEMVAFTALAYGFGYMGMMLSPIHLCFILTREYFSASLGRAYRAIAGPAACVFAAAVVLFVLYRLAT